MNEEVLYQTYLKTVEQNELLKTALETYKNIVNEQQIILQDHQDYKGLLNDKQIKKLCLEQNMISPFVDKQVREVDNEKIVSYGLTSFGYDVRLNDKCFVFTGDCDSVIDVKAKNDKLLKYGITAKNPINLFREEIKIQKDGYLVIPPNSFILAETMESFVMPSDMFGIVTTKSTYARAGLSQTFTTIEPCLSKDTEVLTNNGWINISDIKIGDDVLTLNPLTLNAEYNKVYMKQQHYYKGKMMLFNGRNINQLVTPDHKLWVGIKGNFKSIEKWSTKQAKDVYKKHNYSFDRRVNWNVPKIEYFEINNFKCEINLFMKFLGCWLGDGSAYKDNTGGYIIKLAVVTKPKKREYFKNILSKMDIKFSESEYGFRFYNKDLCKYLMELGHAKNKYIPNNIKQLNKEHLLNLIDGLIASDGNRETLTYTTSSKKLADDIQEVIFKSGDYAIVRKCKSIVNGKQFICYKIRISFLQATPLVRPNLHSEVEYDDFVYDITIPNHIFFMRRNGKASWTGNCWKGVLTLELVNVTPSWLKVYIGEGIAQILFFKGEKPNIVYSDGRKYQNQTGVTLPRL